MARWYIIHAYSGFEGKVRDQILADATRMGLDRLVEAVEVPTETVTEVRRGKKVQSERKFFPGYVLAKLEMNDDVYHLVKNTPKVTGFLGSSGKQLPISEAEARGPMGTAKRTHIELILADKAVAGRWLAYHGKPSDEQDLDALYADFLRIDQVNCARYSALIPGALETIGGKRERGQAAERKRPAGTRDLGHGWSPGEEGWEGDRRYSPRASSPSTRASSDSRRP